jgi:hypothetical protein
MEYDVWTGEEEDNFYAENFFGELKNLVFDRVHDVNTEERERQREMNAE